MKRKSEILEMAVELATGLHEVGAMDKATLREIKDLALLGAAVVAVPVFKRIGLGSVLGYLAAGLAIGPFGLGFFNDPEAIIHVAELGVVLFLFVIGLEMQPSRLWAMRGEIFGLGLCCRCWSAMAVLTWSGWRWAFRLAGQLISGTGFVLTSTAIVMQMLRSGGNGRRRAGSGSCRSCCSRIWPSCRCWRWWPSWRRGARR
jgi:glutathione-regulated potassium-efflux system protein KefB